MLEQLRREAFEEIVAAATTDELIWIDGFVSGALASRRTDKRLTGPDTAIVKPSGEAVKITIAYGTETGNAKALTAKLSALAKKEGVIAKTISLDQYKATQLHKEQLLLVIISTQGDGEPPAAARKFYEHLFTTSDQLTDLRYGVIALGDSSYPQFCQAGKDVDSQLQQLGAARFHDLLLCDTDYEEVAQAWFYDVLYRLRAALAPAPGKVVANVQTSNGKRYYKGTIQANFNLNDTGSEKTTHHIEIVSTGVVYQPGDALGFLPHNPVPVIERILELVRVVPDTLLSYRGQQLTAFSLLHKTLNISCLPVRVVKRYAALTGNEIEEQPTSLLRLLERYPLPDHVPFHDLLQLLEPIAPRLYSISSSPAAHEGEVHIIVRKDEFFQEGERQFGLCSSCLTAIPEGTEIDFYIHPNKRFRLPSPTTDIIMIGTGTGVAPFRSFVTERATHGAGGRNWLFFGDQRFATDFLYQTEWQSLRDSGVLTRINTAFSRDQKEKLYVQDKLAANGAAVYEWIARGAVVYVCGAKTPMSVDVENTLLEVIKRYGGKSQDDAEAYLQAMEESGQYQKDVY